MCSINCSNMDRLKSLSRSKNYRQLPQDAAHPADNNHSSSSTTALVDDADCNEADSRYFVDKREDVVLRICDDNTNPDLASASWTFSDDDEEGGVFHRSRASLDPSTELPAASEGMMKDMDMAADGSGVVRSTAGSRQGIWRECSYDLIAGHHHEVELAAAAFRKNGRSSNSRLMSNFASSSNEVEKSRRRGTSFDFGSLQQVDPPSRLIGTFLQRQKESGEHSLDMNLGFDLESCCPEVQLLAASDHHHSSADQNRVLEPITSSTSSDPFPLPISSRTATEFPIITAAGSMTDLSRTATPATPATAASRIPVRPPISSRVRFESRVDTNTAAPARDSISENSTSGNDDLDYAQQQPMNNFELLQERRELNTTSTPASRSDHESSTLGEPNQEPQEQNSIYSHGLRARRTSTSSTKPASKEAENSISGMSDQEEEAENLKSSPKSFSPRGPSRLASGASTATPFSRVKSRFVEPPKGTTPATSQQQQQRSGQQQQQRSSGQIRPMSGQQRSSSGQLRQSGLIPRTGLLSRVTEEGELEEDLDPFKDIDLPEKFKSQHEKWGWVLLVEWLVLVLMVGALVCSIVIHELKRVQLWGLLLWKWVVVALVTICGRLVSGWVIRILVFFLERSFILRKRVLYFVYALRKGVQNLLWLAFVLITWHFLLNPQVKNAIKVLNYITKALVCFLIAAVLVVVKIFLVKVLASCFHVDKYFERIRDSLFNQFVLETLMGPPVEEERQSFVEDERLKTEVAGLKKAGAVAPGLNMDQLTDSFLSNKKLIQKDQPQDVPKSGLIGRSGFIIGVSKHSSSNTEAAGNVTSLGVDERCISMQNLAKLNRRNVSAWNMKRLINLVKHTGVSTLTHSIEDNLMEADGNVGDQSNREINCEWQAKVAAKQIFKNVARPGRKHITESDLLRFMNEEEVSCTLPLFDGATETGRITPRVLKNWVVNVYRERRALSLSLSDTKTAVNKLHQILNVILFTILIIIWLLVLGIATKNLLVFVSSQLLLVVFIFGNTCKNIFEAIVFLFVLHPIDVGDRCIIDGTQMVVEEMNILSTIFIGDANVKVWYPNSVLATKPIQNFYRSPEMGDNFDFVVDASTPAEKIALLKERIGKYIQSKPHHWKAKFGLLVVDVEEINKLKLSLGLSHTMNYQDYGEKVERKSQLLWEMKKFFEELGIAYHLPTKEVYCHTNRPIESKMDTQ